MPKPTKKQVTPKAVVRPNTFADYDRRLKEIIVDATEVNEGCIRAAKWIDQAYARIKEPFIMLGILKGCIPFLGRICTMIKHDYVMDFMTLSSYGDAQSAQSAPKIVMDMAEDVNGRHVLLVEDVVDTGHTINVVLELLKSRGAKSVKLVTFADKPVNRKQHVPIDFACFEIPDKFLVGFGLDHQGIMRNIPYIGTIVPGTPGSKRNDK